MDSTACTRLMDRAVTGWRAPALLTAGGIGALGAALFMQHVVGVQPCILCVYQRWPYLVMVLLGLMALVFGRHRRLRVALLGLMAAAMVADVSIALYHVGIEQHLWSAAAGCGVPPPAATVEELRARLMEGPVVRCDEVGWSLFGVSLAGYNSVLALAFGVFAMMATVRAARPRKG